MRFGVKFMAAMALSTALVSGCTSIKDHRGFLVDQALVDSVQVGVDNRLSVERTLGRPSFISSWGDPAYYYVSSDTKQHAFGTPRAAKQLILRVRFDAKGNVMAVDRAGMERVAVLRPDGKRTPTLGSNRTFWEDLFGNIGTVGAGGATGSNGSNTGGAPGTGPNGS